jgi:hypothetical protein
MRLGDGDGDHTIFRFGAFKLCGVDVGDHRSEGALDEIVIRGDAGRQMKGLPVSCTLSIGQVAIVGVAGVVVGSSMVSPPKKCHLSLSTFLAAAQLPSQLALGGMFGSLGG